jgi:L-aminopeptidase/D-esterase-like protein
MITAVPGVRVGHWTDAEARTGCTVVLLPEGSVASGEVRGGAPATREFALLDPQRMVDRVDAVVLTGGSAFGLASADGVARWCEDRGLGFPTSAGPVPIVVAMGLFDLTVGDPSVRPGPAEGRAACDAASSGPVAVGPVGAGTGATVSKWRGPPAIRPGGLGTATERRGELVVSALVAVNAFGDIGAVDDLADLGELGVLDGTGPGDRPGADPVGSPFTNTTIGVVVTNAGLDAMACLLVAQSAHDGYARALVPAHTRFDGDAVVAAACGSCEADVELVRLLAARAVERAIRSVADPG